MCLRRSLHLLPAREQESGDAQVSKGAHRNAGSDEVYEFTARARKFLARVAPQRLYWLSDR
jgi:hypothetical protein